MTAPTIGVIGAGVMGASVAYHLARQGARVHCFERAHPGTGTTAASFSRGKVYGKLPRDYFELNHAAVAEHRQLARELGSDTWWHPCGSLIWSDEASFVDHIEQLADWGANVELCSAEAAGRLEPRVVIEPADTMVAHFAAEDWIDGPLLVAHLLDAACRHDATVWANSEVVAIAIGSSRVAAVRLADGERVAVDAIVNAAGPCADRVAALAGVALELCPTRGLLVDLEIEPPPVSRTLDSPTVSIRRAGPTRLQLRNDLVDVWLAGRGPDAPVDDLAAELHVRACRVVPDLARARIVGARVGTRAIPRGGYPTVGPVATVSGYFEAVSHSGMNLGPLLGRLLAEEILTGRVSPLLSPYRPDRLRRPLSATSAR